MTKDEQCTLVRDLLDVIYDRINAAIIEGKVPETWNGKELRELVWETAEGQRSREWSEGRKREYRNTVIVNNL